VIYIRADYCEEDVLDVILVALMPPNRLAIITSLTTGLRIGDVLALRTECLKKERFTIKEEKTGKSRRVRLNSELRKQLFAQAGRYYVFEHRTDPMRHRTRQAINKDLKRACELFRVKGVTISPHTARKIYAVKQYKNSNMANVKRLLNHSSEAVTQIYALADEITKKNNKNRLVSVPKIK
jgi:integrase